MKILVLLHNRLRQYCLRNKVVFVLFVIGGLVNSCMFAYMYGNLLPGIYNRDANNFRYREYRVYFSCEPAPEGNGVDILAPIRSYYDDADIERLIDTGYFESIVIKMPLTFNTDYRSPAEVSSCVFGTANITRDSGRVELTSDDQVLVPYNYQDKVGDSVSIYGRQFQVVGRYIGSYGYMISPDAFKELPGYRDQIFATSIERWHSGYTDSDEPENAVYSVFSDCYVVTPAEYERSDSRSDTFGICYACLSYIASFLAFLFLLKYMSDSISDENADSMIVGASCTKVSALTFIEGLVLSISSVVLGLLLHALLYSSVFDKINYYGNISYHFNDYVMIFFILLGIDSIAMVFFSVPKIRIGPLELRRSSI